MFVVLQTAELEKLHSDIEAVRHRVHSSFAWIVFNSEAACKKAHAVLSKKKIADKPLTVDFCGSKSAKSQKSKHILV